MRKAAELQALPRCINPMHNRGMIYGYARVSSNGQDLAQQLAQLDAAGCTKVYREKVSGATAERPQLKRAIGSLDTGDVLMVTSTDRLAVIPVTC
jgi:DNA invertase Pin-like site-specific DNA recombinase